MRLIILASAVAAIASSCSAVDNRAGDAPRPPEFEVSSAAAVERPERSGERGMAAGAGALAGQQGTTGAPARLRGLELSPYFGSTTAARARALFDKGAYTEALSAFDALAAAGGPEAQPSRYLAALSVMYAGDPAEAAKRFADLESSYPLLADYHRYFAAESAHAAAQHADALRWLDRVDPKGTNAVRASVLRAKVLLAQGKAQGAAAWLEAHFEAHERDDQTQLLYADALLAAGRAADAVVAYRLVLARWPTTGLQKAAQQGLEGALAKLPEKARAVQRQLNAAEELLRGRKLFEAHRSKEAIQQLEAAAKRFPPGSEEQCEAQYLAARSWDKLRKREQAHPLYDAAFRGCEKTGVAKDIYYFGGLSLYRSGKNARAQDYFDALHARFPKASYNDDALIWEAHIQADRGSTKGMRAVLERALRDYPDGDMAHEAAWLLVWEGVKAGAWDKVVAAAEKAMGRGEVVTDAYARGREQYWRARALHELGRKGEASSAYRDVLRDYPLSWYALLAYARISEVEGTARAEEVLGSVLHADAAPEGGVEDGLDAELLADARFERGVELMRLGLSSPAKRELDALRSARGREADWGLALLYHRTGAADMGWRIASRRASELYAHYPKDGHAERWRLAYPRPFEEFVAQYGNAESVSPAFAYGIMRTESGFDPAVESWANAVGLMQLLVPTAKDMADPHEKAAIDRHALQEPAVNIRLGTRFLGRLLRRFGAHPALAAAGYNAGAAPVKKWLLERGDQELDVFVDSIPFRQTRHYVKSVVGSYGAYHFLETGALPLLSLRLPAAP